MTETLQPLPVRRLHEDVLYLPQQTWAKDGSFVTFVGMMHIAPERFYQDIQEKLARYADNGGKILLEGVMPVVPGEKTLDEETLSEFLDGAHLMMVGMGSTKFVSQKDALKIKGTPADLRSDEILPYLGLRRIRLFGRIIHAIIDSGAVKPYPNDSVGRERARSLLRGKTPSAFRFWLMGMPEKHIVHRRNERALAFSESGQPHEHVVLPWGAAHLPGMDKILRDRGYERIGHTNWHPVMKVSDLIDTATTVV